jgi:NADPH-dependent 2,4-dienoyl-CoA reductase/sulfur reductase-like enzyme/pSer/pThr/pTyr-binding forkhead associated (FHA) protein
MTGRRYVVVGDGAAGTAAVGVLRRLDPASAIAVVSDDPHPSYFRAALTNYLLGELRDEQVWAVPPSFYRDLRVDRVLARAASVDTEARQIRLSSGASLPYDALLVATGARARPAPFEGGDLPGVATLRSLQDARLVLEMVLDGLTRAVVVGGGPLALEWAHALLERGASVTLLLRDAHLMAGALDRTASDLVTARLRMGGIDVRVDEVERAVAGPDGRVTSVITRSGKTIPCGLVAVAIGVVCNTELLAQSGVALGPRGGVAVDDRLRASAPGVFAAGDVAELGGRLLQLWEPARRAAEIAAENMTGSDVAYAPGAHYFATRLYDLDFASVGLVDAAEGVEAIVDHPRNTGRIAYRKLLVKDGRLAGALLVGERAAGVRRHGRLYKQLVDEGRPIGAIQGDLLDPSFDLAGWLASASIVAKPPAPSPAGPAPSPAAVRGTQRLALAPLAAADRAPAPAAAPSGGSTAPAAPMLSIGLRLPVAPVPAAPAEAARSHLEGLGRTFPLDREVMSLGRHPSMSVVIKDPGVSSLHAQITRYADAWYLRDAGSRNGTWVNGALVTVPRALRPGDRLRLGASELVFRGPETDARRGSVAPPPPDTPAGPRLEIRGGRGVGLSFALAGPQMVVGREPSNDVRLDDPSVSRRHAILSELEGRWLLSDLHSSRGTYINRERLSPGQETPLEDGDALKLGDVVLAFVDPRRT